MYTTCLWAPLASVCRSVGDVVGALAALLRRILPPMFVPRWPWRRAKKKQFWRICLPLNFCVRGLFCLLARALCRDVFGLLLQPGETKPHVLSRLYSYKALLPLSCQVRLSFCSNARLSGWQSPAAAVSLTCSAHVIGTVTLWKRLCASLLAAWAEHAGAARCSYLACVTVVWCALCAKSSAHPTHAVQEAA